MASRQSLGVSCALSNRIIQDSAIVSRLLLAADTATCGALTQTVVVNCVLYRHAWSVNVVTDDTHCTYRHFYKTALSGRAVI